MAAPGRAIEPLFYEGDSGLDTVSYQLADRGVSVALDNPTGRLDLANDGRPGDLENVDDDIEIIEGSGFDDRLLGSDGDNVIRAQNGADVIAGRGGNDIIDEGSTANGADTISGGDGTGDRISYGTRTNGGVRVSLDGVRNDGAGGEQDNVSATVEHIGGTNFGDVLSGTSAANTIDGFGGSDTIDGLGGNDTLSAGAGANTVVAGSDNDVVFARNGAIDNVDCGEDTDSGDDTDTVDRDTVENRVVGCERVQGGLVRLAPKALEVEAGQTARLELSGRHPEA